MMRPPRSGPDEGFTLVELMVVVILVGVLGAVVASTTIQTMQSTRRAQVKSEVDAQLRTALERVTRDLRVADPLRASPSATTLSMDVGRAGRCQRMTYTVTGGALTETTVSYPTLSTGSTPGCTGTATGTTTRTVLRDLLPATRFSYVDEAGAALTGAVDASDVARVTVQLSHRVPEGRPAARLSTSVELRNRT